MTKSGVGANKMGKHIDKSMKVENGAKASDVVAAKSLNVFVGGLRDARDLGNAFKIAKTDAVAAKSLNVFIGGLESIFKIVKIDIVAAKSLDVLVGGLGNATKSATIITKR